MKKNIILVFLFFVSSCIAGRMRPSIMSAEEAALAAAQTQRSERTKAIWIRETDPKKDTDFYLEAAQDGSILSREENSGVVMSRRGKITARFAKDLIRETERSEAMSAHSAAGSDLIAEEGLKVYAYISGELTIAEATLNELGRNFEHALMELTKEVSALPLTTTMAGLLYCDAVEEADLPAINKKIAIDGKIEIIETSDIKRFLPLMSALIDPGRMIPLETRDTVRQLSDFINKYDLYGSRSEFILPSTRGTFACHMKNTYRTGSQQAQTAEEKYEALDN